MTTRAGASPAVVGVGQVANKDGDRIVHPAVLVEAAARVALEDAGIRVEEVGLVLATPFSSLGGEQAARMVTERLGIPAALHADSTYSGAAPQQLLAQACRAVADGVTGAVLVVGGIADASVQRARLLGIDPPAPPSATWSQGSGGTAAALRRIRLPEGYTAEASSGAGLPAAYFALVESALGRGTPPADHRAGLGRLLAPFTEVAARRPDLAWFPEQRTPSAIAEPGPANRLVAEPYTKLMCSFPTVDLAAAVVVAPAGRTRSTPVWPMALVTSYEAAPPSGWAAMDRSTALERAVEEGLRLAGADAGDIDRFDLYSCFPAAVQLAAKAFGMGADDPRPWTSSGGLAAFGGPGSSYSLHGLACMVEDLRARPGEVGAVVSVGGMVTDFALGIYSTVEAPFAGVDFGPYSRGAVGTTHEASGRAVVDAMTVLHHRDRGPVLAPVIARLPDGTRTGARAADPDLPAAVAGTTLVGREVELTSSGGEVTYELV